MSKLVFANKKELPALMVLNNLEFYDNAHRGVLIVEVSPSEISLDKLDAILSDSGNLAKLRHVNEEDGTEDVFDHYQIKIEMAKKPVPSGVADENGTPITEERIVFKLGRLTPIEIKLAQLGIL